MHRHGHFHEEQEVRYDPRLFMRMLGYARPYVPSLLGALAIVLLVTAVQLAQPYVLKIAIDDYILGPGSAQGLQTLALFFLLLYTMAMVLHYLQFNLLMGTGQRIINDIRNSVFAHMQTLSIPFFDRSPAGRLVTRVTNDAETLNEMYTSFLINLFKDLFMLIGIVIIMLRMHVTLALLTFTIIPPVLLAVALYRKKARQAYRELRRQLARINAAAAENIEGIRVIQAFLQEKRRGELFMGINQDHYRASLQELQVFAVFRPVMDLFRSLALAVLLWFGMGPVIQGTIPFGVLFAFITYVDHFFRPLNDLSDKYNILQAAMASAERLFELLDEKAEIASPLEPVRLTRVQGRVSFEQVWFAYRDANWVLRDVNFSVQPGETVAVIGPTGAGKSSLINLINRFYDVQKGAVSIDGHNVKTFDLEKLRRQVGVVQQDVFLFSGTIRENITLNRLSLSNQQLETIARQANAFEFISKLPLQWETPLGERGASLSTGQRQLLAFARILAFQPSIFILDEATAHIDTYTEKLLQDSLQQAIRGRTSFIIAHRLSTVRQAQRIFFVKEGRLTEIESFQQLVEDLQDYFGPGLQAKKI